MDFRENLGEEIAGALRQLGLDPAGEHRLQFYFYFPAEQAARALAARLAPDGFTCDVDRSAAGGRWLCLVQRAMPADVAALTALGKRFLQLTSELEETPAGAELSVWLLAGREVRMSAVVTAS